MQRVAQGWLVLTLTGSPFWLGVDAFLGDAPFLVFSLFGGVLADRAERRRILLVSQVVQMSCALVLMALILAGQVTLGSILALSFLSGLAQAFGAPAFQALFPTLVPAEEIPKAIALNSIQFNLARVDRAGNRRPGLPSARRGRLHGAERALLRGGRRRPRSRSRAAPRREGGRRASWKG